MNRLYNVFDICKVKKTKKLVIVYKVRMGTLFYTREIPNIEYPKSGFNSIEGDTTIYNRDDLVLVEKGLSVIVDRFKSYLKDTWGCDIIFIVHGINYFKFRSVDRKNYIAWDIPNNKIDSMAIYKSVDYEKTKMFCKLINKVVLYD